MRAKAKSVIKSVKKVETFFYLASIYLMNIINFVNTPVYLQFYHKYLSEQRAFHVRNAEPKVSSF